MENIVEKYKVVTIGPYSDELDSVMFSQLKEAKIFASKQDSYLIMENISNADGRYAWKVLAEGDYQWYKWGIWLKNSWPIVLIAVIAMTYLVYRFLRNRNTQQSSLNSFGSVTPQPTLTP